MEPAPYVALLTPPGLGAVAVLRLEGPGADRIMAALFRPRRGSHTEFTPDRIVYGTFHDGQQPIDDVLVVPAPGGGAFDICAHGGVRVVERTVMALTGAGAGLLSREEAARRAWPASNAVEQEVWQALARARTPRAVRFLLRQRTALPAELHRLRRMAAEAPQAAQALCESLLAHSRGARFLVSGATVAVVGPTNAGKSTLANRLLGLSRSVVSPEPGTTLDWVAEVAVLAGVQVTLLDTPGYGAARGALDAAACARAEVRAAAADLHLRVFDGSQPPPAADDAGGSKTRIPALLVLNKSDLGGVWTPAQIQAQGGAGVVQVSAADGTHLDRLIEEMGRILGLDWADEDIVSLFTDRQVRLARGGLEAKGEAGLPEAVGAELLGEMT